MGFLSFFSFRIVDDFAASLSKEISLRYPAALDKPGAKKLSVSRLTRILEDVCKKAENFQKANALGMIKRARLGNEFRWQLKDKGYSDEFVEVATEAVLMHTSRATTRNDKPNA